MTRDAKKRKIKVPGDGNPLDRYVGEVMRALCSEIVTSFLSAENGDLQWEGEESWSKERR